MPVPPGPVSVSMGRRTDELDDGVELCLAADQRGRGPWQVPPCVPERPQRRKRAGQAVDVQLPDLFRGGQILEAVLAKISDGNAVGQRRRHQRPRHIRQKDLTAMTGRRDLGGPMDVDPDVVVAPRPTLAGVQPHPDAEVDPGGPVVRCQGSLSVRCGSNAVERGRKDGEERITVATHVGALVVGHRLPDDGRVHLEHRPIGVAQPGHEPCRVLDVGEQERHSPSR